MVGPAIGYTKISITVVIPNAGDGRHLVAELAGRRIRSILPAELERHP
jgi:hypothetical protein